MTETFGKVYDEVVERLGENIARDVHWFEENATMLLLSPNKRTLVVDLREEARRAMEITFEIERHELGTWRALLKELKWYLRTRWYYLHKHIMGGEEWLI